MVFYSQKEIKGNDHVFMGLICISVLINEPKSFPTQDSWHQCVQPRYGFCLPPISVSPL